MSDLALHVLAYKLSHCRGRKFPGNQHVSDRSNHAEAVVSSLASSTIKQCNQRICKESASSERKVPEKIVRDAMKRE